MFSKT